MNKSILWAMVLLLCSLSVVAVVDTDLVALWDFENSCTAINETRGTGINFTTSGTVAQTGGWRAGSLSCRFAGGSAETKQNTLINTSFANWTFIGFYNKSCADSQAVLTLSASSMSWGHLFGYGSGGNDVFFSTSSNSAYNIVSSGVVAPTDSGKWRCIAIRFNTTAYSAMVNAGQNWSNNSMTVVPYNYGNFSLARSQSATVCNPVAFDDIAFFKRALSLNEIKDYCANGTITSASATPSVWVGNFSFIGNASPLNATSYYQDYVNFSQGLNINNDTVNCSLVVYNRFNASTLLNYTNGSLNVNTSIAYYVNFSTPAWINWSVNCTSLKNKNVSSTSVFTVWLDTVIPQIAHDFVHNITLFSGNLSFRYNLSDDFWLYSYNVTIDGSQVNGGTLIGGLKQNYTFQYSVLNLGSGAHTLKIRVADGHTKRLIDPYEIDLGQYGNQLKFSYVEDGVKRSVKIKEKDSEILDQFNAVKREDRYTWSYIPASYKENYTFIVETDQEIDLVDAPGTYLKKWLVFGSKWLDFYLPSENAVVSFEQITKKKYAVTVGGLSNTFTQNYESIGELNVNEINLTFYKVNATVQYTNYTFFRDYAEFILNLSGFYPGAVGVNVSFNYNNNSFSAIRTNSGNMSSFNATFVQNESRNASWLWTFNFSTTPTNYNITGNQTVYSILVTNCSTITTEVAMNMSYFDELTLIPMGASTVGFFSLYTNGLNINNYTLKWNNQNISSVCIYPSFATVNTSGTLYYSRSGYDTRYFYFNDYILSSTDRLLSFYLSDSNQTDLVVASVVDSYNKPLFGATVRVYRYYPDTDQYLQVESQKTNFEGSAGLNLVLYSVGYVFYVDYNGVTQSFITEDSRIYRTALTFIVNLENYNNDILNKIGEVSGYVTYSNATKFVSYGWNDPQGYGASSCLEIKTGAVIKNTTCSVANSGIISYWVNESLGEDYHATGYLMSSDNYKFIIGETDVHVVTPTSSSFGILGTFLTILFVGTIVLAGINSPVTAIVLCVFGLYVMDYLNFVPLSSVFLITLATIGSIVAYMVKQ